MILLRKFRKIQMTKITFRITVRVKTLIEHKTVPLFNLKFVRRRGVVVLTARDRVPVQAKMFLCCPNYYYQNFNIYPG